MHRTARTVVAVLAAVVPLLPAVPAGAAERVPLGERAPWCTRDSYGEPRPVDPADRQVAREALATEDDDFVVQRARATPLGVVALVSGDVREARQLLDEVRYVAAWGGLPQGDFPAGMRVDVVLQELVGPVLDDVARRLRGVDGSAGLAFWDRAAAGVVLWKAPAPAEVLAVAGVRDNGVEIRVLPRLYSDGDLRRAMQRLHDRLDRLGIEWSTLGACATGRGLELGVPGSPRDARVVRAQLREAAGMRVRITGGVQVGF